MTDLFVCGSRLLSLAQFINSSARGLLTNVASAHANYWTMVSYKPHTSFPNYDIYHFLSGSFSTFIFHIINIVPSCT